MPTYQTLVLNFWNLENRALAVFEGKLIGPSEIKADADLAKRYWQQQLEGCKCNWDNRNYSPRQSRW